MNLLPPLIRHPVHPGEAALELRLPGCDPLPMRPGAEPARSFDPGWHRRNLQHPADLPIYDSPEPMERPTEVLFNDLEQVRDTTPFLQSGHHDWHSNFVVDRAASFAASTGLVRRHSTVP